MLQAHSISFIIPTLIFGSLSISNTFQLLYDYLHRDPNYNSKPE